MTKKSTIYDGEKPASSIKSAGKTAQLHVKNEIRTLPNTISKNNSKWIEDLNVRPDTLKLLEKSIGRTLFDINPSKILFDPPPGVMKIKTKINKGGLVKLNSLYTAKKTISIT